MKNVKEIICVICPNGCVIEVGEEDNEIKINGKCCKRGKEYILQEYIEPKRVITTTVKIVSKLRKTLPVKTSSGILKKDIFMFMNKIKNTIAEPPVVVGQIIYKDVFEGIDLISEDEIKE